MEENDNLQKKKDELNKYYGKCFDKMEYCLLFLPRYPFHNLLSSTEEDFTENITDEEINHLYKICIEGHDLEYDKLISIILPNSRVDFVCLVGAWYSCKIDCDCNNCHCNNCHSTEHDLKMNKKYAKHAQYCFEYIISHDFVDDPFKPPYIKWYIYLRIYFHDLRILNFMDITEFSKLLNKYELEDDDFFIKMVIENRPWFVNHHNYKFYSKYMNVVVFRIISMQSSDMEKLLKKYSDDVDKKKIMENEDYNNYGKHTFKLVFDHVRELMMINNLDSAITIIIAALDCGIDSVEKYLLEREKSALRKDRLVPYISAMLGYFYLNIKLDYEKGKQYCERSSSYLGYIILRDCYAQNGNVAKEMEMRLILIENMKNIRPTLRNMNENPKNANSELEILCSYFEQEDMFKFFKRIEGGYVRMIHFCFMLIDNNITEGYQYLTDFVAKKGNHDQIKLIETQLSKIIFFPPCPETVNAYSKLQKTCLIRSGNSKRQYYLNNGCI